MAAVVAGGSCQLDSATVYSEQLDSEAIYGVREPTGFTRATINCRPSVAGVTGGEARLVVDSVTWGYTGLQTIPLCGQQPGTNIQY